MSELTLNVKTRGGFVRCLSGLFITKENPNGLTPTEIRFLGVLLHVLILNKTTVVTKEIKIQVGNLLNMKLQIVTNYVSKLKSKGVIMEDNELHSVCFKKKITINYGENHMQPSSNERGSNRTGTNS